MGENPAQVERLLDWLFSYGPVWVYLALFAACFVENLFPPFPGDSFIIAAGALVAMDRLDLALSYTLVIAGGVASTMVLYYVGRSFGRDYFIRKDFKYFSAQDISRAERSLEKWGVVLLLLSRFVVGFRAAIAVVAGLGKYPSGAMLLLSTVSYLVFAGLLMYLAFVAVENLDRIVYYYRTYNLIVIPVVLAMIALFVVRKIIKVRKGGR